MFCSCVTITIVIPARVYGSRYESQDHGCAGLWPDLGWYVSLTEQTTEGHVHARLTSQKTAAHLPCESAATPPRASTATLDARGGNQVEPLMVRPGLGRRCRRLGRRHYRPARRRLVDQIRRHAK